MKKIIIMIVFVIFLTTLTVLGATQIAAYLSGNTIYLDGLPLNQDWLQNPVIEYEGRTYLSVRDVAARFDREVLWNESRQEIRLYKPKKEYIITKAETAYTIAKAMVEDRFSDRITENTKYVAQIMSISTSQYYSVYVIFDAPEGMEDAILGEINYNYEERTIEEIYSEMLHHSGIANEARKYYDYELLIVPETGEIIINERDS